MSDDGMPQGPLARSLYLVISGAVAPEGVPALVAACQAAGWRVTVFATPVGATFIDPGEAGAADRRAGPLGVPDAGNRYAGPARGRGAGVPADVQQRQ